jgi:hypothetical protein
MRSETPSHRIPHAERDALVALLSWEVASVGVLARIWIAQGRGRRTPF